MNRVAKVRSSVVLSAYIRQRKYPSWTAFYMTQNSVKNDQFGQSHFNWKVDEVNYHVLRTGAFPFIKYHCTKSAHADLRLDNAFYGVLKFINFGIPTLLYGIAGLFLARHKEYVTVDSKTFELRFWYKETW